MLTGEKNWFLLELINSAVRRPMPPVDEVRVTNETTQETRVINGTTREERIT